MKTILSASFGVFLATFVLASPAHAASLNEAYGGKPQVTTSQTAKTSNDGTASDGTPVNHRGDTRR